MEVVDSAADHILTRTSSTLTRLSERSEGTRVDQGNQLIPILISAGNDVSGIQEESHLVYYQYCGQYAS